jgi:hypothetical protein
MKWFGFPEFAPYIYDADRSESLRGRETDSTRALDKGRVRQKETDLRVIAGRGLTALSLTVLLGHPAVADPALPLELERTIPLQKVSGRIDHMGVDLGRRRLLVAELGNDTVDVVDIDAGSAIGRISGLSEPQGVAFEPLSDLIIIANGGDGRVRMFHARDLSPSGEISLGDDADNVRVYGQHGQVIVGYGSGGLAIIDPSSSSKLADIKLAAHPESFQLAPKTKRLFVNVPNARQIAVIDLGSRRQIGSWTVPEFRSNFPLAMDETGSLLATVFRSPARLVLIDTRSGAVAASRTTCVDADDVFFDFKRRRIYVSCGEGAVDVFQSDEAGTRQLARVNTSSGARTSLFVPELDRLFVAARADRFGSQASILVLRPVP